MEKRIKEMVEAMEGKIKPKGKKYVDDEEYKKKTGKKPDPDDNTSPFSSSNEDEEEEGKPRKGRLFGKGISILIAIGKKKEREKDG